MASLARHHASSAVFSVHRTLRSFRDGLDLDNRPSRGSFFGQLKEEFYRHQRFPSSIKFMAELDTYIHWYNHVRIREKLRGLSPRQYRMQFRQSGTTALIDKRTTDGCT